MVFNFLTTKYRMHNLYAIFLKNLNICKRVAGNLVNESGNVPKRGIVPKPSEFEIIALNMTSEAIIQLIIGFLSIKVNWIKTRT